MVKIDHVKKYLVMLKNDTRLGYNYVTFVLLAVFIIASTNMVMFLPVFVSQGHWTNTSELYLILYSSGFLGKKMQARNVIVKVDQKYI